MMTLPSIARRWRPGRRVATLAVAGALVAVAGACGSDDEEGSATSGGPAMTTAAPDTTSATTDASETPAAPGTTSAATDAPATTAGGAGPACVADVATVVASGSTAASDAPLPAELVATLEAAATASFEQAAAPGAIVGVQTPEGTWTAAYGLADPDAGTPMEVGMHTRIGSVTKTFTGTVIMQLVEQGLLSLDDTIDEYVADVPNGDEVTIRMLADMTSGIASYTRSSAFTDILFGAPETAWTPAEVLQIGLEESPIFEPGASFDYSNSNTVLLGLVIEDVTGQPVEDVFEELVFEPLGLDGTSWPDGTDVPEPFPQGFTLQGNTATPDNPANATHWDPSWGWTAGELISTMDDLLVYGRSLGNGRGLLGEEAQTTRLTSFPGEAGYGIAMGCVDGWVGHTGELPGYNTSFFYDTTADTTVIVQVNSDIASGDCSDSPTLVDDPRDQACSSPATRMFVAISDALGHPFPPMPQS